MQGENDDLEQMARTWHSDGPHRDVTMPIVNADLMKRWSSSDNKRFFESAGLFMPATVQEAASLHANAAAAPAPDAAPPRKMPRYPAKTVSHKEMKKDVEGCQDQLRQYFGWTGSEKLRVALIGNGPLSQNCRDDLRNGNFDHVVRFNDQKNLREGDAPSTLHFVRERPDGIDAPFTGLARYRQHAPLVLLGGGYIMSKPLHETEGIYPCPDGRAYHVAGYMDLGKCVAFKGEEAAAFLSDRDKVKAGPSTGMWAICLFQLMPEVAEIHTFGMNWAFDDQTKWGMNASYPHTSDEGWLVRDSGLCCKVTVHETPIQEYDPEPEDGAKPSHTSHQEAMDQTRVPVWTPYMMRNKAVFKQQIAQKYRNYNM